MMQGAAGLEHVQRRRPSRICVVASQKDWNKSVECSDGQCSDGMQCNVRCVAGVPHFSAKSGPLGVLPESRTSCTNPLFTTCTVLAELSVLYNGKSRPV
eukprot:CAMPEP_0174319988 /NCGR_PEP_ID=MMETSP0810-20121108/9243_1 /TAXON_ID=73025 ORGANISM="Eutreptiella gymnastica-like, Strain CCMP1594" /NCGR_SAMPLE_ID=MMETSP0810 /ASSEMBLY_ACC=CAM_ASM_000659 /LENGTH=98 /DNA_ID=CAMNT_0015430737 /DNA_START=328 /DNA_END=624 /DNA_ORIENTATION=+